MIHPINEDEISIGRLVAEKPARSEVFERYRIDYCCRGKTHLPLSPADRERLLAPDAEGVYFCTEGPSQVRYFVEKDFPCVHPGAPEAGETHGETFAPPLGFKVRHGGCDQRLRSSAG